MQILLHQPLPGINEQHDYASRIDRCQRFNDAELFDGFANLTASPHAGRVY